MGPWPGWDASRRLGRCPCRNSEGSGLRELGEEVGVGRRQMEGDRPGAAIGDDAASEVAWLPAHASVRPHDSLEVATHSPASKRRSTARLKSSGWTSFPFE